MFLSDRTIRHLVGSRQLVIDPFDPDLVQPCSYDLTLGDVQVGRIEGTPWIIGRQAFVLASTRERVELPDWLAATVSGKSTWGRRGLAVHVTAGHVDPGFRGQITLEMVNHSDLLIPLVSGMPIAQLVFTRLDQPAEHPYQGRYQDQMGVTPPIIR